MGPAGAAACGCGGSLQFGPRCSFTYSWLRFEFINLKLIKTGIVEKLIRDRFSILLIESIVFTIQPLILWFLLD